MNPNPTSAGIEPSLILCIDDGDIALRVRKLLLTHAGYRVLTARSAEDGLDLFKSNAIDLVIADHFLSGKTGTEFAKEMKMLKPAIPILIYSAAYIYSSVYERPIGLEFADEFLAKCEPPQLLLDTIARLLANAN